MGRKHDDVAKRLAQREGTEYNKGQGADVKGNRRIVEVETTDTIADASRQLAGYKKPVYVAGADAKATASALKRYKDTTIGVMDDQGKIVKPSTRKRKSK